MDEPNAPAEPEPGPAAHESADVIRAIEAIVLVAPEPVEPGLLAQLLEVPVAAIERLCQALAQDYETAGRGFQLVRVAGGYRFQSHPDLAPYVERFVLEGQTARLSAAALETLAIVAYKQPISRAQIASVRGVDPDGVLRTLQARGYVDQVARDPGPGNATLWGTTPLFLEKLGLNSLADLPPLAEYVPGADVVEALEHGLRIEPVSLNGHANGTRAAEAEAEDDLDVDLADDGSRTSPLAEPTAAGGSPAAPDVAPLVEEASVDVDAPRQDAGDGPDVGEERVEDRGADDAAAEIDDAVAASVAAVEDGASEPADGLPEPDAVAEPVGDEGTVVAPVADGAVEVTDVEVVVVATADDGEVVVEVAEVAAVVEVDVPDVVADATNSAHDRLDGGG